MALSSRVVRLEARARTAASVGGTLELHLPVEWDEFADEDSITPCPEHGVCCRLNVHRRSEPGRFVRIYALEPGYA
jgi:hypothetical protein